MRVLIQAMIQVFWEPLIEGFQEMAAAWRAFRWTLTGRTKWRHPEISEDEMAAKEAEGFIYVRMVCQLCGNDEGGMVDPAEMDRNFECGSCHRISARAQKDEPGFFA